MIHTNVRYLLAIALLLPAAGLLAGKHNPNDPAFKKLMAARQKEKEEKKQRDLEKTEQMLTQMRAEIQAKKDARAAQEIKDQILLNGSKIETIEAQQQLMTARHELEKQELKKIELYRINEWVKKQKERESPFKKALLQRLNRMEIESVSFEELQILKHFPQSDEAVQIKRKFGLCIPQQPTQNQQLATTQKKSCCSDNLKRGIFIACWLASAAYVTDLRTSHYDHQNSCLPIDADLAQYPPQRDMWGTAREICSYDYYYDENGDKIGLDQHCKVWQGSEFRDWFTSFIKDNNDN